MVRPALGAAAKNKIISTRITANENYVLTQKYGSPGKAFRAFVDSVMRQHEAEYLAKLQGIKK